MYMYLFIMYHTFIHLSYLHSERRHASHERSMHNRESQIGGEGKHSLRKSKDDWLQKTFVDRRGRRLKVRSGKR